MQTIKRQFFFSSVIFGDAWQLHFPPKRPIVNPTHKQEMNEIKAASEEHDIEAAVPEDQWPPPAHLSGFPRGGQLPSSDARHLD